MLYFLVHNNFIISFLFKFLKLKFIKKLNFHKLYYFRKINSTLEKKLDAVLVNEI